MFDSAQMAWIEKVLAVDKANPAIKSIVLGMHAALPHSFACGHSMSDYPIGNTTGTRVYHELLKFKQETNKPVYVLASHSHFLMTNIFDTDYWRANGGVLPGWIIGTAGAQRYRLPDLNGFKGEAQTDVYGYLLYLTRDPDLAQDLTADAFERALKRFRRYDARR